MANCGNCGKNITLNDKTYRREIYSGSSKRINFGKRISLSNSSHFVVKNVCERCAENIDKSNNNLLIFIMILAIVIGLFMLIKY